MQLYNVIMTLTLYWQHSSPYHDWNGHIFRASGPLWGESTGHGKFGPISFVHNIHFNRQIVSKFCTEHGNITVVLFLNFETIGQFMGRLVFARLELKKRFGGRGGVSYMATATVTWYCSMWSRSLYLVHSPTYILGQVTQLQTHSAGP